MEMEKSAYPERKRLRLQNYDYSLGGAYSVTICTAKRKPIFWYSSKYTLSRIIKQFKGSITKQIGFSIWQKSFIDRVIRNEVGYREVWQYIDNNPRKLSE